MCNGMLSYHFNYVCSSFFPFLRTLEILGPYFFKVGFQKDRAIMTLNFVCACMYAAPMKKNISIFVLCIGFQKKNKMHRSINQKLSLPKEEREIINRFL